MNFRFVTTNNSGIRRESRRNSHHCMRICVFCGSSPGNDPAFVDAARATGKVLVEQEIELVYGGARVGLMGAVADAVLVAGGSATGIMPHALVEREIAHQWLTTLHVVDTMHERKTMMSDLSDGFIALPGGAGTLEEIFEQWTWAQLGIHQKPCGFLNVKGYFDPLREMIGRSVSEGFMAPEYQSMLAFATDPRRLLAAFRAYRPPPRKWAFPARSSSVGARGQLRVNRRKDVPA